MEQELYVLIEKPEVQDLIGKEGFDDNACFNGKRSRPGYFVNKAWYDEVCYKDYLDSINK